MKEIYLDGAATTCVKRPVVEEMLPYFGEKYGNPSSPYALGEVSRKAVDHAREKIAKEINAKPWEIVFTSGLTESNNLALFGIDTGRIFVSSIEHESINAPCQELAKRRAKIVKIPVDYNGLLRMDILEKSIRRGDLVSVMHVNNIIGTVQDIKLIGDMCKIKGAIFHTDAAQSFGKLKIDVKSMNIGLLSASAHKIGGPKGVGFLYVKEGLELKPLVFGGGQEMGMRGGTENVPGIVGFAKALEIEKKVNKIKIEKMRNKFIERLEKIGGRVNGSKDKRIYNNIHTSFLGIDATTLVKFLSHKGIYVATGSACDTTNEDDHVLKSIGLNKREIEGSIRITLDDNFKEKDIDFVVREIEKIIRRLKNI